MYIDYIYENTYCVEPVVNEMLQIFTHPNLPHQLVLISVHSSQLSDVSEYILKTIRQLEGVNVVQAILYM